MLSTLYLEINVALREWTRTELMTAGFWYFNSFNITAHSGIQVVMFWRDILTGSGPPCVHLLHHTAPAIWPIVWPAAGWSAWTAACLCTLANQWTGNAGPAGSRPEAGSRTQDVWIFIHKHLMLCLTVLHQHTTKQNPKVITLKSHLSS